MPDTTDFYSQVTGDASSLLDTVTGAAGDILSTASQDITSLVAQLKNQAATFSQTYDTFEKIRGYTVNNPQLAADWAAADSYATTVKNTVSWINQQVDSAVNWLSGVVGLGGISRLGQIGAIPLITAAYLIAASAAVLYAIDWMVSIISRAQIEKAKVDLVASGQADQTILTPDTTVTQNIASTVSSASNLVMWLIIGAAAWYFLPKLAEKYGKGDE
jgi:hypothetical protein